MKKKLVLANIICILILIGCNRSSFIIENATNNNSNSSATDDKNNTKESDSSVIIDDSNEKDNSSSIDSSNTDSDNNDDVLWESPMADFIPESPYASYISFLKEEISAYRDNMFFSDYITGDFKYTCCDLSGDGVRELVLSYPDSEEERLLVFGYDSETDEVFEALDQRISFEYDCISKYGFVLVNVYKDEEGNLYSGKTDDLSCTQWIDVVMTGKNRYESDSSFISWKREAGSSEFDVVNEADFDSIMEMAEDKVTLSEAKSIEDVIPYLEECEKSYEEDIETFKLSSQQGEGLISIYSASDIPDKEYEDAESAYEAFINDETCVRCEYGIKIYESHFSYFYGDKYTLSQWYVHDNEVTIETRNIDCGSDGTKELVIDITDNSVSEPMVDTYVISFYKGHLYLRFVTSSWSRSCTDIGDDGYIISDGSSGSCVLGHDEAILDSDVIFHEIYNLEIVAGEGNKDYFTEAYEKVPAGEFVEIYIYWIDGRAYYVPYHNSKEVADSLDYTDFMNACVECGISFSTQEEVDAIIEAKKAEYGF